MQRLYQRKQHLLASLQSRPFQRQVPFFLVHTLSHFLLLSLSLSLFISISLYFCLLLCSLPLVYINDQLLKPDTLTKWCLGHGTTCGQKGILLNVKLVCVPDLTLKLQYWAVYSLTSLCPCYYRRHLSPAFSLSPLLSTCRVVHA